MLEMQSDMPSVPHPRDADALRPARRGKELLDMRGPADKA